MAKPPFPRTIITFLFSSHSSPSPSFLSLKYSQFSSSAHQTHSSSSSSRRHHEEESRNVRVSVWWDFENCSLPAGVNAFRVAQSITAAVRASGIKGPVQITAFGDICQLARSNQEALSSTGINLTHIPRGGKNSADRSLLVDLMYWVSQNPPPAHLFLISGDRDFASVLHRLRMSNYNILLASPETAPGVLCSAASIMWHWSALVKGENLTGKHYNQPPDGPYGSWYGHYKVPLADPFLVIEQPASSQVEQSSEPISDIKPRPIPKTVTKQIRHILYSYPEGVSITELRSELGKSNVSVDKDLYGFKKFSRFLLAMPHILKLRHESDGQFIVHGIAPKVPESTEPSIGTSPTPVLSNGDQDVSTQKRAKVEDSSITKTVDVKSQSAAVSVEESPNNVQEPCPLGKVVPEINNAHANDEHSPSLEDQHLASEEGFFQGIWRKWFSGKDDGFGSKSQDIEKDYSIGDSSEKTKFEDETVKLTSQRANPLDPASLSSRMNGSVLEDKTARDPKGCDNESRITPGFFSQIFNWFNFRRPTNENSDFQSSGILSQLDGRSGNHEIFAEDSFWSSMESFIETPKGSKVISQSKTRLEMAQKLQKDGPVILRSIGESDLLHLVELIISEKKWVEECPSHSSPFKLAQLTGKNSVLGDSRGSIGLRSLFVDKPSRLNLQRIPEQEREKRFQNLPHTGVSSTTISKKLWDRSRNEILADCQKLVDELLKEHPDGFNMGSFRKLFVERYGYCLDVQKLGYLKLTSLLEIMPGVKIEQTHIMPCSKVSKVSDLETAVSNTQENTYGTVSNSNSELHDASRKEDYRDSPWEELGPVAGSALNSNEPRLGSSKKSKVEKARQVHHEYEPLLSEDDSSDSEGECPSPSKSRRQGKPRNEEDSSLLQILDSWYTSKDDSSRRAGPESVDGMVDSSRNAVKPCGSSGVGIKAESPASNSGRKQRPIKSFTFVSDSGGDSKDKLIDGILGSLKKSGESRLHS